MSRTLATAAVVVAAALCAAAAPAPKVRTIEVRTLAFGPAPAGLRVGDVVEWVNLDVFVHSATARNGGFDLELAPKARVRMVLKSAGVIPFYCRYHPGMTGELRVAR